MIPNATSKSDYRKLRMGRKQIRVLKGFTRHAARLLGPDEFVDGLRGPFARVSSSSTAKVYKCRINFNGKCMSLYLKQHLHRSPLDYLKHLVRPARAMREFRASLMLARNGIDTPAVIAVGCIRTGLFNSKNFLITAELQNARSLFLWICRDLPPGNADTLCSRRRLICQLGESIGRMHAAGIAHGDLRPGNVFVAEESGRWRFFLLDNERTRKFPLLPCRLIVKNLVQVGMFFDEYVSPTDRLRFLKHYLTANPRFKSNYKRLAARVLRNTKRRMRSKNPGDFKPNA